MTAEEINGSNLSLAEKQLLLSLRAAAGSPVTPLVASAIVTANAAATGLECNAILTITEDESGIQVNTVGGNAEMTARNTPVSGDESFVSALVEMAAASNGSIFKATFSGASAGGVARMKADADYAELMLASGVSGTLYLMMDAGVGRLQTPGELVLKSLIGSYTIPDLPTSNPGVLNALWNDAGTLKISAG